MLRYYLRQARRWGRPVTVGIAAVCDWGRHVVLASDQMISTNQTAGDGVAIKIWSIHQDWGVLYAGDDISHVSPIYQRAKKSLDQKRPVSVQEVTDAMVTAYRAEVQEEVVAYLRSRK